MAKAQVKEKKSHSFAEISAALLDAGGDIPAAAKALGITRSALHQRINADARLQALIGAAGEDDVLAKYETENKDEYKAISAHASPLLIAEIEKAIEKVNKKRSGKKISKSKAITMMIALGLPAFVEEYSKV